MDGFIVHRTWQNIGFCTLTSSFSIRPDAQCTYPLESALNAPSPPDFPTPSAK